VAKRVFASGCALTQVLAEIGLASSLLDVTAHHVIIKESVLGHLIDFLVDLAGIDVFRTYAPRTDQNARTRHFLAPILVDV